MKKNKKRRISRDENSNSPFENKKRFCPFSQPGSPIIDYKDIRLLSRYVSEKGKIVPSRIRTMLKWTIIGEILPIIPLCAYTPLKPWKIW